MSETPGQVLHRLIDAYTQAKSTRDNLVYAETDYAAAAAAFLAEMGVRRVCRVCGGPEGDPEVTLIPNDDICTACALGEGA